MTIEGSPAPPIIAGREAPPDPRGRYPSRNGDSNKLYPEDRAVHEWYRFVLSFPPHLVRDYARTFGLDSGQRVLDPFCGTGTTVVECKKLGLPSVGLEVNPLACFASQVKIDWRVAPDGLVEHAGRVAEAATAALAAEGVEDAPWFTAPTEPRGALRALPPERQNL
ncbi:MAG: hypothetical protein HY691_14640, partial [Chloroflexi bacterium]|nr:hypothetical protein [Chloroflexota bacterium]